MLHASLVQAGSIVMKNASEMFGQFGKRLYLQTGSWHKATNAVARKIAVALYYVQSRGKKFFLREVQDVPAIYSSRYPD